MAQPTLEEMVTQAERAVALAKQAKAEALRDYLAAFSGDGEALTRFESALGRCDRHGREALRVVNEILRRCGGLAARADQLHAALLELAQLPDGPPRSLREP